MGRHFTEGTPVYDVNGDKVGAVSEQAVQGDNLVLQKGLIFPHDYYVPLRAVSSADADGIHLNVTKDDVTNQTFDNAAATSMLDTASGLNDTDMSYQMSDRDIQANPVSDRTSADYGYTDRQADYSAGQHDTPPREGDVRVPVREEQLNVGKQQTEAGRAHVHKDVIEEQQSVDVPVTHEELRVEHVPAQGNADLGPDAFTERDIDVPLRGEQVVANKNARVAEEVHLHKQQVTENQHVGDTVRKERVRIEGDGIDQAQGDMPLERDTLAYDQNMDDAQPRRGI